MKKYIKQLIPKYLLNKYKIFIIKKTHKKFSNLPTVTVMTKIYSENWWGRDKKNNGKYFSGRGSHDEFIINPYISAVRLFLEYKQFIVIDLGCGDFNVGRNIFMYSKEYIACDIVEELVNYNKVIFKFPNLKFLNIDLIKDNLPEGDVLIIRQVLQHLSNENILKFLNKVYKYKFLIITEPIPKIPFVSNLNNPNGPDIRLSINSGINLEDHPFKLKYISKKELLKIDDTRDNAYIVTTIYELN